MDNYVKYGYSNTYNCDYCGKEFELTNRQKRRKKYKHFCSDECRYESKRKTRGICEYCGTPFIPSDDQQKYCSVSCKNIDFHNRRTTEPTLYKGPKLEEEVIQYYMKGNSINATQDRFHIDRKRVCKTLSKHNIEVRPSHSYSLNGSTKTMYDLTEDQIIKIQRDYIDSDMKKKELQRKYSLSNGATDIITKGIKKQKDPYRYLDEKHHRAHINGYVPAHIYIATTTANRNMLDNEVVHHINMNHKDNSPDNLYIMDNKKHSQLHGSVNKTLTPLINSSILTLNKKANKYQINELLPTWYEVEGKYNFEAWKKGKIRPKKTKIKKEDKQVLLFP